MAYPKLVETVVEQLIKLPGVGRRSAERIVFWLLDQPSDDVKKMADGLIQLKEGLRFCRLCSNLSETEICRICSDPKRNGAILCVVEDPKDVIAFEKTGAFEGHYHVLLGSISPSNGRGPQDIRTEDLISRIKDNKVTEVIVATDADTEGEMTALHVINSIRATGVKISRIGVGIPVGSCVEYADLSTLSISMIARREV